MIKNVIFLFVVLAAVFVVYLPSYMQMQDLWNRNQVAERRIKDLEASNVKLGEERDRLVNDPEYLEKIARERMGLIREDEVIYKVVPQGTKKPVPVEEVKKPVVTPKKRNSEIVSSLKENKAAIKAKAKAKAKPKSTVTTNSTVERPAVKD
ncbi:MAG: septum formation initiator family protein [Candidatus Omnitrophica bacterium]|nr:septum formation initiator family protein [Candidatus Omnitrophota bacterium]